MSNKGPYALEIKVVRAEGACTAGHRLGDTYTIPGGTEKLEIQGGGICIHAVAGMISKILAMRYGVEFWWAEDPDVDETTCPDSRNLHVFQIRRIREVPEE